MFPYHFDAEKLLNRKLRWPTGPWHNEPDSKQWTSHGLACAIVREHSNGHLCGYVGVEKSHPSYGVSPSVSSIELDDFENWTQDRVDRTKAFAAFSIHRGITFVSKGEKNDLWWFGFDCGHSHDIRPRLGNGLLPSAEYRTFAFVERETEKLARFLYVQKG